MIATVVDAKNVRKAAANDSRRLVKSPNPRRGNPKIFPVPGSVCAMCVNPDLSRLEYSSMASSAQIVLWHAEKVATQVEVGTASNGIHFGSWGETRIPEGDIERLVAAVPAALAPALF